MLQTVYRTLLLASEAPHGSDKYPRQESVPNGRSCHAHFDFEKPIVLETGASNSVIAAVLFQWHRGLLKPVAFVSKKMKLCGNAAALYMTRNSSLSSMRSRDGNQSSGARHQTLLSKS
jgi:hypothetical protein